MRFVIIATPSGQAPEEVRQKWIGVELETLDNPGAIIGSIGVLGGAARKQNSSQFIVDRHEAVAALREKSPEAANWFNENVSSWPGQKFSFGAEFCRELLHPGEEAEMTCYKPGCEGVAIKVTLGRPLELPYLGLKAGRLSWPEGVHYQGFELSEFFGGSGYCNCPKCATLFGYAVVVFPPGTDSIIFGYDPESA